MFRFGVGQRLIGGHTEPVAVGDLAGLADAAHRQLCRGLRGIGIPDRPRVGLALGECRQRVGRLEEHKLDV